jgi:hypothetical protein
MMYGVQYKEGGGDLLDKVRRNLVDLMMQNHMNIIVDNTNLHPKQKVYYTDVVEEWNAVEMHKLNGILYELEVKDFTNVSVAECIKRNRERPHPVPDKVIYGMYNSYLKKEVPPLIQNPALPHAIVVDLDGTMALMTDRSPYEMSKVYGDVLNGPVATLVETMYKAGVKLFFISGRDECARAETVRWLRDKAHLSPGEYELYLRPDNDPRKDTQFKKDIWEEHLKDKYFVEFWIEDRWRMADAVRNELGIMCLQCADGHF